MSKTKAKKRLKQKTNPEINEIVSVLMKEKKKLWRDVLKYVLRTRKKAVSVNIEKINKLTKGNEIVIIPGKVLGKGELNHNLVLSALKFSKSAEEKLSKKASILSIPELVEKYNEFKGVSVKIII